jgi:WD40 repeat protein
LTNDSASKPASLAWHLRETAVSDNAFDSTQSEPKPPLSPASSPPEEPDLVEVPFGKPSPRKIAGEAPISGKSTNAYDQEQRLQAAVAIRFAGDCELGPEIGRGGMGIVYRGRESDLDRDLAIKVLREDRQGNPQYEQRFLEEGHILGQLQHPGIVPIHASGRLPDGRPFFTMKLVKGQTLAHLLRDRGTPGADASSSLPRLLAIFEQVCQTMAYAHSRRVIHRDLKPANIMVGAFGEVQVMDWGLAKVLASESAGVGRIGNLSHGEPPEEVPEPIMTETVSLIRPVQGDTPRSSTQTGAAMGTWAYMPPEQARGEIDHLDECCDVFSLGAILCEILTGRPPYTGPTAADLPYQARQGDLADAYVRLAGCGADAELVEMAQQCLSRERGQRPKDAGALARAVTAHQAGVQERLRQAEVERAAAEVRAREERKRRRIRLALQGSMLLLLVALIVGTAFSVYFAIDADQQAQQARQAESRAQDEKEAADDAKDDALKQKKAAVTAKDEATKAAEDLRRQLANSHVMLAEAAWREGHVGLAHDRLDAVPLDLRHWEWRYLKRTCSGSIFTLHGHIESVSSLAYSPDGAHLASGSADGTVKVWDARTGQEVRTLAWHTLTVSSLAFSPDGAHLASGSDDHTVKVWDVGTGQELRTLRGHTMQVRSVAFSPDGAHLASGGDDNTVKVWNVGTGQELRTLRGHTKWITSVAFSPDGANLVSGSYDDTLKVWNASTGQELRTLQGHSNHVLCVAFSADSARLVSGSSDQTVKVWDTSTGRELRTLKGHTHWVSSVAFSPDGARLATGSRDQTVRLWDARTGRLLYIFRGHTNMVNSVAFSPDGTYLASGSGDQTVKVWRGTDYTIVKGHTGGVSTLAFSPDGVRLASGSFDQTVKVWDVRSGQELLSLKGRTVPSTLMAPSWPAAAATQ